MRRTALARARVAGIRAWLILVLLAPGAGPAMLGSEPVREALKDSEWFDYERDDYRRYNPEDIEVPEDDWRCRPPERDLALPDSGAVAFFLNILVYLVLAGVVALIFYLIYRVIQERRDADELPDDMASLAVGIEHAELPAGFAAEAGIRESLNQQKLRELIEAAFASGDLRAAAIYLYLFALLRLSASGLIEIANDRTARDYVRQLAGASAASPPFDFPAIARNFEFALYADRLPVDVDAPFLRDVWRSLDAGVSSAAKTIAGPAKSNDAAPEAQR